MAQDAVMNIKLPATQKSGGLPLMEALNNRHSERSYSKEGLSK